MGEEIREIEKIIAGPAGDLEVRYAENSGGKGLVVMCHPHPLYQGSMDNKVVTIAVKSFAELGFHTVRFNYRGVGKSQGKYGEGIGETEDLLAVVNWARKHYAEKLYKLYLGGFSFGCYVAYRGAGILNPEALLMIAPAVEHLNFEGLPVPLMPLLVIQGEADEVVSAEATYQFVETLEKSRGKYLESIESIESIENNRITLERLPSVGHFFHGQLLTLKGLIKNYFGKL
jgi:alpha/beta superfamily hydrolase